MGIVRSAAFEAITITANGGVNTSVDGMHRGAHCPKWAKTIGSVASHAATAAANGSTALRAIAEPRENPRVQLRINLDSGGVPKCSPRIAAKLNWNPGSAGERGSHHAMATATSASGVPARTLRDEARASADTPPINAARTEETSDSIDATNVSARTRSTIPEVLRERPRLAAITSTHPARIPKLKPLMATRCCAPHAANGAEAARRPGHAAPVVEAATSAVASIAEGAPSASRRVPSTSARQRAWIAESLHAAAGNRSTRSADSTCSVPAIPRERPHCTESNPPGLRGTSSGASHPVRRTRSPARHPAPVAVMATRSKPGNSRASTGRGSIASTSRKNRTEGACLMYGASTSSRSAPHSASESRHAVSSTRGVDATTPTTLTRRRGSPAVSDHCSSDLSHWRVHDIERASPSSAAPIMSAASALRGWFRSTIAVRCAAIATPASSEGATSPTTNVGRTAPTVNATAIGAIIAGQCVRRPPLDLNIGAP